MSERRPLTSTYRLQLHAGFTFADATATIPYLADLGVSHLYLSPVLQAAPGSTHGYDVVDHGTISRDLGGEDGLRALADAAHRHGLGIVVDVVPNHMAIPSPLWLNGPLWETLRDGPESSYAHWFDVDWDLCDGRIGLPLLGESVADAVVAGLLRMGDHEGSPILEYRDQTYPLRADTALGDVTDVLGQQHYLLACWHEKDDVLGYRRFFDVDTLIAIRVELSEVFDATHRLLLEHYREGTIDGFRIDHPDGLTDPEGYLETLREATDGAWVVVEKILAPQEQLPPSWACAGTTGYDALTAVQAALAPPTGETLEALWQGVIADEPWAESLASLPATERDAKAAALELLQPEVGRLVRRAVEAAVDASRPLDQSSAKAALEAMLVHVEVYRAYLRVGMSADRESIRRIDEMVQHAKADQPELAESLGVLRELLVDTQSTSEAGRDLVVRFQQVCGPVMAKGVEDTTFYRWHRFIALNEVGGDPLTLEDPGPSLLHEWALRQSRVHPDGMTTLSTHDTKRDEDVRAQLIAAADQIGPWIQLWSVVPDLAQSYGVDEPTAYLLMQTVIGAWPISEDRLRAYAEKAVREAKQHTSWSDPDNGYEARVGDFAAACLSGEPVEWAVAAWMRDLADATQALRLAAKLVQLTLPGVPDVYQGTELISGFLVDPDNRGPVDFTRRATLLERLRQVEPDLADAEQAKLWVTSQALRLRRDRPDLFGAGAGYTPIETTSRYAWGFLRGDVVATLVQRSPSGLAADGFGDSTVTLPRGEWSDVLSGHRYKVRKSLRCSDIYQALPVALLVKQAR